MRLEPNWEYVSDSVMGGVSQGRVVEEDGITTLTGSVSLENNGGFVQMAFNLCDDGRALDLSDWTGISMSVKGNGEHYELRVRTAHLDRPWQSYKAEFLAPPNWRSISIPFADLVAHRTDKDFDATQVRRIGILAIGKSFEAKISVKNISLYRK